MTIVVDFAADQTPTKPSGKRCKVCGFRVRGKHHEEGIHHKTIANDKTGSIQPRTCPPLKNR